MVLAELKKVLLIVLVLSFFLVGGCKSTESDIPLGFSVLGTIVPPEYENPDLHDFVEQFPSTDTDIPKWTQDQVDQGYVTYAKNYMDSIFPHTKPSQANITNRLSGFSAHSEYEPITFTIYALPYENLTDVSVSVSDLTGPGGSIIKSQNIDVRSVRYWPRIAGESLYEIRPWFLEKRDGLNIPENTSQRYWLTVYVPSRATAGTYNGTVTVDIAGHDNSTLSLALEVPDIQLMTPPMHQGMYYHIMNNQQFSGLYSYYPDEYYYKEVMNMKEHGMTTVWIFNPEFDGYVDVNGDVVFDLDPIAPFVEACMQAGFDPLIWNMTIGPILNKHHGPSPNDGKNFKGFIDSYMARGWGRPIASHGDETDGRGEVLYQECLKDLAASKQYAPKTTTYTTIVHPINSERFEPNLDIRVFSSYMDSTAIAPTRAAGRELWMYSGADRGAEINRLNRGWFAAATNLDGMTAWVYYSYPDPNLPFDDLVSRIRGCVLPSPDGPLPTPDWEGFREGVEDRKYIFTLEELIAQANASGDSGAIALAASAQSYMDSLYAKIWIAPVDGKFPVSHASTLLDADFYDNTRLGMAGHIKVISDALANLL